VLEEKDDRKRSIIGVLIRRKTKLRKLREKE